MADVEFQEKMLIMQARGVGRHGFLECHVDKMPFVSIILPNTVSNGEEVVGALNDRSSERIECRNSGMRIRGGGGWWSCVHDWEG